MDLFDGRNALVPVGRRYACLHGGRVKIFGVAGIDPKLVAWLSCQPTEECLQHTECRINRRRAQPLPGPTVYLFSKMGLECFRLLNVKFPEVTEASVAFEPV